MGTLFYENDEATFKSILDTFIARNNNDVYNTFGLAKKAIELIGICNEKSKHYFFKKLYFLF